MSKRLEEERKRMYLENFIDIIMDGNSSDLEQLEEEDDDEEWTPQAMLDDRSSDSSGEEDYQEGSGVQSSIEVEVPATQDTIGKQSVKYNAKKKNTDGEKNNFSLHPSISLHLMRKG